MHCHIQKNSCGMHSAHLINATTPHIWSNGSHRLLFFFSCMCWLQPSCPTIHIFYEGRLESLAFSSLSCCFHWYYPFDPSIIGTCNAPLIRLNDILSNQTNGDLLGFGLTTCLSHQSRQDCPYMQYVPSTYTLPYFLLHMCLLTTPIQWQQHVSVCCSSFVLALVVYSARYCLHFVLCVSICDLSCMLMPTVRPALVVRHHISACILSLLICSADLPNTVTFHLSARFKHTALLLLTSTSLNLIFINWIPQYTASFHCARELYPSAIVDNRQRVSISGGSAASCALI